MKLLKHLNIRSSSTLLFLAILSLAGFFLVENTKILKKSKWYDEKLEAALLSQKAEQAVKNYYLGDVEFVNNLNDPNETGLIGFEYSPITSERGSFLAKSCTTNPNFAALVVQYLKELGAKEGDYIAVGMTGSFPALNISVCAALQTLKLNPVIISSVASSSWGANDPEFTWLDMATVLSDSGIIHFKPVAASIGASQDIGGGLSSEGVGMIKDAIDRNHTELIYFDNVQDDIDYRMKKYSDCANDKPIRAYINIGGGIASLGSAANGTRLPPGLNKEITPQVFKEKKGVVYEMSRQGIPVIHMLDIPALAAGNDLPIKPIPLPLPGEGKLFVEKKYDLAVVGPVTFVLLALIIFVIYQDRKNVRLGTEILRSEQNSDNDLIV